MRLARLGELMADSLGSVQPTVRDGISGDDRGGLMKRRSQLGRVLRRDNRLCGIHLGGCAQTIEGTRDGTVDHIVPSAFFAKVAGGGRHFYERDWNCQPMHVACNQSKAWPKFRCDCHYLQVEDGHLFILTRGRTETARHILLRDVVSTAPERVDARVVIGPGKRVS